MLFGKGLKYYSQLKRKIATKSEQNISIAFQYTAYSIPSKYMEIIMKMTIWVQVLFSGTKINFETRLKFANFDYHLHFT